MGPAKRGHIKGTTGTNGTILDTEPAAPKSIAPTGWTSREHTPGPMAKPSAPWVGKPKRRK